MTDDSLAIARPSRLKSRSIGGDNLTGVPGSGGMATEGTGAGPARRRVTGP
jgi:hypothetical protein